MPRPGIPPALEKAVLEQAGKGLSQREIAAWLKTEHRVGVTHVTVGKLLKRIRAELGESTRAVAVNELAPQVVGHIEALNAVVERARAIEEAAAPDPSAKSKAKKKGNPLVQLKALELQRKAHVDVLKISGAGEADDKPPTVVGVVVLPAESDD